MTTRSCNVDLITTQYEKNISFSDLPQKMINKITILEFYVKTPFNVGFNKTMPNIVSMRFMWITSQMPMHVTNVDQSSQSRQYSPEREVALISSMQLLVVVVQFFFHTT